MVSIRELTLEDGAALAAMLNDDVVLRSDLNIGTTAKETADSVVRHVEKWCRSSCAVSYAILADGVTVGLISLAHIDAGTGTGTGGIGYWVGSSYRRRRYCTQAFEFVLEQARLRGLHTVATSIVNDNTASQRIWEKAGGIGTPASPERTRYQLRIERQPSHPVERP